MKRADRIQNQQIKSKKKGNGLFWFMLIFLCFLGWYLYQQYKPSVKEKIREEISSPNPEDAAEAVSGSQPVGKEMAVQTIYRIYEGVMDTSEGTYVLDENPVIYLNDGIQEWDNLNSLTGMEDLSVYINEEKQVTGIAVHTAIMAPEHLRILLEAPKGGYYDESPEISCTTDYWASEAGKVKTCKKEEVYAPDYEEYEAGTRIILQGAEENAVWKIGDGTYRGTLELVKDEPGWYIINKVYFEQYLYGVVPSEMPDAYGKEAAKVQAVCSRSYAYTQWRDSSIYAKFGAHMDNTVSSQVYGKAEATANAIDGVEETRGQMLLYNGQVVTSYFFSTSCGITADAGDVWGNGKTQEFPTETPRYLKGNAQYLEGEYTDLSEEAEFYAFITDTEIPSYDADSPWYRWSAVISTDGLLDVMLPVIQEISSQKPYLVQTLSGDRFVTQSVNTIGNLKNIYVYSRAESGIITGLLIEGTERTLLIRGENSIRKILAAGSVLITLKDGSEKDDQMMLPSAFFTIEKGVDTEGHVLQLTLYGGGYGHGVGMSQYGVQGMLKSGASWDEILKHYYNGIEIGFVPV